MRLFPAALLMPVIHGCGFLAKPQKKQSEAGSSGISSAGYLKYWLANFILYRSASFGSNVLSSYPSCCIFFKSSDGFLNVV